MRIIGLIVLLLISAFQYAVGATIYRVTDYGADSNGLNDSFYQIQRVINLASKKTGDKIIVFPKGKYLIFDNTLSVWGSSIQLIGEGDVILEKRGNAGWWGDLLDVSGLIKGYNYYGLGNSNSFAMYRGETKPSINIKISNITFQTNSNNISKFANNVGVINSTNVVFDNCFFKDAPQTNLAIVNEGNKFSNNNIQINDCTFSRAGDHNLRVISYNSGKFLNNTVNVLNSKFYSVLKPSTLKEISGIAVHVWYRGRKDQTSLDLSNCDFDNTGNLVITMMGSGFSLENSSISNSLIFQDGLSSQLRIKGNKFGESKEKSLKLKGSLTETVGSNSFLK